MAAWLRSLVLFGFVGHIVGCGAGGGGSRTPGGLATEVASPDLAATGSVEPDVAGPAAAPQLALSVADWRRAAPRAAGPFELLTEPGELPHLELARDAKARLALEHTRVTARLSGFVAEVEVKQTYANPHDTPTEVTYVFPLPENSAVHHLAMVIGARTIEGKIERRERARRAFEAARAEGHTAALLEQERPNIFTQTVTNIAPREKIEVAVRYVQDLSYDRGQYEFVFPMVVGPRYMPGAPTGAAPSGGGTHADTTQVPDASRISPPYMGQGQRSGHDISLEVVAEAGSFITAYDVPTHEVTAQRPPDGRLALTLREKDSIPNRDFVLRYQVAGDTPRATLFTEPGGAGYVSLVVQPPDLDVDALVGRREFVFVVDVSGSMAGTPLALCQRALRSAFGRMRPVDTFNLLTFSGGTRRAFAFPRPANQASIRQALAIVNELEAGGGTEMADAVSAALDTAPGAGRNRYVFFLTDGYVGNEDEIVRLAGEYTRALTARGQRARVFAFGVGSSPNRLLIEGLARAGQGLGVYASSREDPLRAVNAFYHYVDRAVLTDLQIDWGGATATELIPEVMPDLFASHAFVIHGKLDRAPSRMLQLRGRAGERTVELPIEVRPAQVSGDPRRLLGALWARSRIGELELGLLDGAVPDAERRITELGLEFSLLTRFTSFLAVDTARRVGDGAPRRITQPSERPEAVDLEATGGEEYSAEPAYTPLSEPGLSSVCEVDPSNCVLMDQPAPASEAIYAVQQTGRRGCGCRAAGERSRPWSAALLTAVSLALLGRRTAKRRRDSLQSGGYPARR